MYFMSAQEISRGGVCIWSMNPLVVKVINGPLKRPRMNCQYVK